MGYFTYVLGAEKIPKGDKHIEEFAKYCKIDTDEFSDNTFLVSDGPNDMRLAKTSSIFAVGITNTVSAEELSSAGANIIIANFDELSNYNIDSTL